ncbi:Predicted oxidoreductase (related to aryl-alcohol dehydrogenase) [Chelatococcus sambhunathii]|uniref:Predicted oxidoreductase (Related to aryl-alcohol dehydrogenase) n=1 Tax=Chelatococcus sambhunathii TaxID=363953 RepID=A0ABM9U5S0_9HYPH|nr:aldo/keto reductase [Chelatococcus sambhunathii]CUA88890.1 Predicted oxidoreductase (related to aryl-alcohol dehydrogenase) [Chelatococcus sambhunathii]
MSLATRTLGRSNLKVTVLGFGTAPLGDLYATLDDATAIATVEAALGAGIMLLDTSPHYGNGLAEHRCGTALRRHERSDVVLSTKVGRVMDPRQRPAAPARSDVVSPGFAGGLPHKASFDYSYDGAMRSFEQSLLRLGTDRIDVLLIHDVDVWTHGADGIEARFKEAMDGAYRALADLRDQKVIKAIGVGINEADMCERFARAGDFDCMLLAGRYSLLEQPALEGFLPLAQDKNIGVMLGGVFNSGILATGAVPGARYNYAPAPDAVMDKVRRIEAVCRAHSVPLAHAALHFALGHPAVASVVLGGVTPEEVSRNVAAFAASPPAGLWRDLKSEGLLAPDAPIPA